MGRQKIKKINLFVSIIFGIITSVCYFLGDSIWKTKSIELLLDQINDSFLMVVLLGLLITIFVSSIVFLFICFINYLIDEANSFGLKNYRHIFMTLWIIQLLFFLPCYISFLPGIYSYDIASTLWMISGRYSWSNGQPILYSFIWLMAVKISNIIGISDFPLVFITTIQFLFNAATLVYAVLTLLRCNANKIFVFAAELFYLLSPILAMASILSTKDIAFSAFFLLFVIKLIELYRNNNVLKQRKFVVQMIVIELGICFFRNNGVYVLLSTMLILFIAFKKKALQICFSILAISLAFFFMVGPVFTHFEIINPFGEMLSVPLCQLSNVYNNYYDELSDKEIELIEEYIPNVKDYEYFISDSVKEGFNTALYRKESDDFWILWKSLMIRYPRNYAEAFLCLNVLFWSPVHGADDSEYVDYIVLGEDNASVDCFSKSWYGLLPQIHNWYLDISNRKGIIASTPIIRWFTFASAPIYFMMLALFVIIVRRDWKYVIVIFPLVILFGTYLLGPTCQYRYLLPFLYTLPVLFGCMNSKEKESK